MAPQSVAGCLLVAFYRNTLLTRWLSQSGPSELCTCCVDLGSLHATLGLPSQLLRAAMKLTDEDCEVFMNFEVLLRVPGTCLALKTLLENRKQLACRLLWSLKMAANGCGRHPWALNAEGSCFQHEAMFLWESPWVCVYFIFKALW